MFIRSIYSVLTSSNLLYACARVHERLFLFMMLSEFFRRIKLIMMKKLKTLLARHWSSERKWKQSSCGHRTALWARQGRSQTHGTTATYDIRLIHVSRSSHSTDSMKLRTYTDSRTRRAS